jgi:hypothetical protein
MTTHRTHVRNLDLWLEIYDRPIFNDEDSKHYESAWEDVNYLSRIGKLSSLDLLHLQSLIDACIAYGREQAELDATDRDA